MKKVFAITMALVLFVTGICFAEKHKLKKKDWSPVQTRTEKSGQVQDFYNHKELYHEGAKQVGLWFVTFVPDRKPPEYSYFYEAVVMDYETGKYRIIRVYQADKKNKIDKATDKRFADAEWEKISGTKYETLYHRMKPSIW